LIYFMQPVNGGAVKIGYTDNLPQRQKALEAYYQQELSVLATMDGGIEEEHEIHRRFAKLRFGRTEQFRPAPELMEFIQRPIFAAAGECVEAMPTRFRHVYIQLTADEHRKLRIAAATAEKSVSAFARDVLTDLLNQRR